VEEMAYAGTHYSAQKAVYFHDLISANDQYSCTPKEKATEIMSCSLVLDPIRAEMDLFQSSDGLDQVIHISVRKYHLNPSNDKSTEIPMNATRSDH
jgi:hypothetical protein